MDFGYGPYHPTFAVLFSSWGRNNPSSAHDNASAHNSSDSHLSVFDCRKRNTFSRRLPTKSKFILHSQVNLKLPPSLLASFRLQLKTIISILHFSPSDHFAQFCLQNSIHLIHLPIDLPKEDSISLTHANVAEVLSVITFAQF